MENKLTFFYSSFKNKSLFIETMQFNARIFEGECVITFLELRLNINKIIVYLINIDEFLFKSKLEFSSLNDDTVLGLFNNFYKSLQISDLCYINLFYYILFEYRIEITSKGMKVSELGSMKKKRRWLLTKKKNISDMVKKFIYPKSQVNYSKKRNCDICMDDKNWFFVSLCNHECCLQCIIEGMINNIKRCFMCKREFCYAR